MDLNQTPPRPSYDLEKEPIAKKEAKEKVLEYLKRMPFYKWAAAFAMIDVSTLENYRKEDPVFSDRCESARSEAIERLGKRATPDFMLKNADPHTFKEKKEVEVSGDPLIIIKNGNTS